MNEHRIEIRNTSPAGYAAEIFLDGERLDCVTKATVNFDAEKFTTVTLELVPTVLVVDAPTVDVTINAAMPSAGNAAEVAEAIARDLGRGLAKR